MGSPHASRRHDLGPVCGVATRSWTKVYEQDNVGGQARGMSLILKVSSMFAIYAETVMDLVGLIGLVPDKLHLVRQPDPVQTGCLATSGQGASWCLHSGRERISCIRMAPAQMCSISRH